MNLLTSFFSAWSGGMIYSAGMQRSIDRLIGNVIGNTSEVGAAPSNSSNNDVGGGYDITQIYRRVLTPVQEELSSGQLGSNLAKEICAVNHPSNIYQRDTPLNGPPRHGNERTLLARDYIANKTDGYRWYGHPIGAGMPLPGNYSGFAGTLAEENIRISNAFITGILWFLILLGLVVGFVAVLKWCLELLSTCRLIKRDRLEFFREHWTGYTILVALRTCFLSFFLVMFLTIFEFSLRSSAYVKIVAAIMFLIFVAVFSGAVAYAWYYKRAFITDHRPSKAAEVKDLLQDDPPWLAPSTPTTPRDADRTYDKNADNPAVPHNIFCNRTTNNSTVQERKDAPVNIHDNSDFIMKLGWLASRCRCTRWWFFTVWLAYEFLRAIFLAGASGYPLVQVFGLTVLESVAFAYVIRVRPFEGRRLNILLVCL